MVPRMVLEPEISCSNATARHSPERTPCVVRTFGRQSSLRSAASSRTCGRRGCSWLVGACVFWVLDLGVLRSPWVSRGWAESGWSVPPAIRSCMPAAGANELAERVFKLLNSKGPMVPGDHAADVGCQMRCAALRLSVCAVACSTISRRRISDRAGFSTSRVDEGTDRYDRARGARIAFWATAAKAPAEVTITASLTSWAKVSRSGAKLRSRSAPHVHRSSCDVEGRVRKRLDAAARRSSDPPARAVRAHDRAASRVRAPAHPGRGSSRNTRGPQAHPRGDAHLRCGATRRARAETVYRVSLDEKLVIVSEDHEPPAAPAAPLVHYRFRSARSYFKRLETLASMWTQTRPG